MNLSKSKYVRGLQCPKQLWLDKYKSEEYCVDESTQSAFNTGNIVGDLARKYFGKCTLVDFDKGIDSMLKETQDFINSGEVNIAEASFLLTACFAVLIFCIKPRTAGILLKLKVQRKYTMFILTIWHFSTMC